MENYIQETTWNDPAIEDAADNIRDTKFAKLYAWYVKELKKLQTNQKQKWRKKPRTHQPNHPHQKK